MRPNHQNRRMRGRNRKGPNPLTRSYESNGPDVKVRGTPQHIAEKYTQLARDAQVSGDPVMAENYLQHAEHYIRIIITAQAAQQQQLNPPRPGEPVEAEDDGDDYEEENDRFAFTPPQIGRPQGAFVENEPVGTGPQPTFAPEGQGGEPRERFPERQPRFDPQGGGQGQGQGRDRFGRRNRFQRGDRAPYDRDRDGQDQRPQEARPNDPRPQQDARPQQDQRPAFEQPQPRFADGETQAGGETGGGEPGRRERFEQRRERFEQRRERGPRPGGDEPEAGLPAFLTNPVRQPAAAETRAAEPRPAAPATDAATSGEAAPVKRGRGRPRKTPLPGASEPADTPAE